MGVGYIKYDVEDETKTREWFYTDGRDYTQLVSAKFMYLSDRSLVFYNDKKDVWGSVVKIVGPGDWRNLHPKDEQETQE